ncbi:MAG TPA: hypothetical protein VL475_04240 [Planctomycetaceae bacterium]|jgi:hypothetical protein|nr:hypothetical protein [Planctomycetaceae bacterium]
MVRETRFSFEDGMNVDFPRPRDSFDDDLDDLVSEEPLPVKAPRPSRGERSRSRPDDHRPDRRHLAGADWMKPAPGDDVLEQDEARGSTTAREEELDG